MDTGISKFSIWMVNGVANPKCDWKNNRGNFLCRYDNLVWANSLEAAKSLIYCPQVH